MFAAEILILVIGYFVYFTPIEYPRNYLNDPVPESGSLTKIASEKGFHIVTAVNVADNPDYRKLVPSEFNSITPENYTKWRQLLVSDEIGNYDFSKADGPPRFTSDGSRVEMPKRPRTPSFVSPQAMEKLNWKPKSYTIWIPRMRADISWSIWKAMKPILYR